MAQAAAYVPIYFAPDLDPSWTVNPGLLTSVTNLVPTKRNSLINYACTYSFGPTFSETTYGVALTGVIHKKISGAGRLFVATLTRLLEYTNNTTMVDRSKGATDYLNATDFPYNRSWDSTTYGDDVIFVSKKNPPQVINSGAAFADLGGSPPKAACCTTNKNFVILGNCNDGVNDLGDQVWWSALGNDASWAASASTQAGNYRLVDTPGNVTALVNLRDSVIAYKDDSIYVGDYQGSPLLWTWRLVSDRVGCSSPHGVAVVNGIHYFVHRTGIYRFDGASVQPVGYGANQFLFQKITTQTMYATVQAVHDEDSGAILWYFGGTYSTFYDRTNAFAYHPQSGRFGFVLNGVQATDGVVRGIVKASLADISAWDSSYAGRANNIITLGSSSNTVTMRMCQWGATITDAVSLTTGHIGDETDLSTITRVKPRMLAYSGTLSNGTDYVRAYEAASRDAGTTLTADSTKARWDGTKSARWHELVLPFSGSAEVAGLQISAVPSGKE